MNREQAFHADRITERRQCVWWLSTCTVAFLSSEVCFQESGMRQFYPFLGGHSAQWVRADPLFFILQDLQDLSKLVGSPHGPAFRN